jgi:putative membrane protein insertion efficiency factor
VPLLAAIRGRVAVATALAVAALLVAADLSQPPERQGTATVLLVGIRAYRTAVSPVLSAAGLHCRFQPTCSRYAEVVIRRHGALSGSWRALTRVARCGPWTPAGTVDRPR